MFGRRKRHITRLLIVEDEPLVAFDNEHVLTDAGFEIVATVDRAGAALAALRAHDDIDLVVADVRLADGSGVDVARAAQAAGIAVLFVTGQCPAEARALAIGCLAKPYAPRDLVAAIQAIETRMEGKAPRRLPTGLTLFGDDSGGMAVPRDAG
ncbi:response regulator [Sphingomonas sp.]|uniref:response regulator n=1 Tax=Sphingomonas sp. TaxID=28214 RepID=UPI003CC69E24